MEYFGPMMKKIAEEQERKANRQIKKYRLTLTQAKIIIFLYKNENMTTTQKELEDYLSVSHPTTVTIVKSMQLKGFIECYTDINDKRMKIIKLIWGDEQIYKELYENAKNIEKNMLKGFSKSETEQLSLYLNRIYKNVGL